MRQHSFFTQAQLDRLLSQSSISSAQPWCTNNERLIDEHYKAVCESLTRETGASARIEWNHYGSGYASFIDAWFYKPTPEFFVPDPYPVGEEYFGLVVLLSRLSPHYVFMQGRKHWHATGSSSYLPAFGAVDELICPGVVSLARHVQPLLERFGLRRLCRAELSAPLHPAAAVPTILTDGPYTEFDALFYWED